MQFGLHWPGPFSLLQFAAFIGGTTPLLLLAWMKPAKKSGFFDRLAVAVIFMGSVALGWFSGGRASHSSHDRHSRGRHRSLAFSDFHATPIIGPTRPLPIFFRVRQINAGWNDNTLFYFWDQAVHILILLLLSPWKTQALENNWPILGCLFVVVTHFATVTIWFVEKDIYGRDYPETEEKYISILQRLVVWLAFLLPHPWWIFVLAFVLVSFFRHVWTRRIDFSWTSVVMGNALAVVCGLISRFSLGYHF